MRLRNFILLLGISILVSGLASAREIVHDPEFVRMEKEFAEQWSADEAKVREKLAVLERRFGKKPNIVYIMADDVGYTELGSYGGGKLRGAAYAEPRQDGSAGHALPELLFRG